MHSLEGIKAMNNNAVIRAARGAAESETSRHCSYSGDVESGLVLHSAKQRSTVFLSNKATVRAFLAAWFGTNSAVSRDALVERYFNSNKN